MYHGCVLVLLIAKSASCTLDTVLDYQITLVLTNIASGLIDYLVSGVYDRSI